MYTPIYTRLLNNWEVNKVNNSRVEGGGDRGGIFSMLLIGELE